MISLIGLIICTVLIIASIPLKSYTMFLIGASLFLVIDLLFTKPAQPQ